MTIIAGPEVAMPARSVEVRNRLVEALALDVVGRGRVMRSQTSACPAGFGLPTGISAAS